MRSLALCFASLLWSTAILASDTNFQSKERSDQTSDSTVDFVMMGLGYCDALSFIDLDSKNNRYIHGVYPKPNPPEFNSIKSGISLLAIPEIEKRKYSIFRGKEYALKGYSLFLVNSTNNQIAVPSSDGKIFITCEALNPKGVWSPIEYIPPSGCGNSYYSKSLPAKHHWEFIAPTYSGNYKTKLRFHFQVPDHFYLSFENKKIFRFPDIYSNVFDGYINEEQFINQYWGDRFLDANRFEILADGKTRTLKFRSQAR